MKSESNTTGTTLSEIWINIQPEKTWGKSEVLIKIQQFWLTKLKLKMSSAKWRPFCLEIYFMMIKSHMTLFHHIHHMINNSLWPSDTIWRQRSGQHWLRKLLVDWRHQAITWTNVDLSLVKANDIHLMAASLEIPQPSITECSLKITYLNSQSNQGPMS